MELFEKVHKTLGESENINLDVFCSVNENGAFRRRQTRQQSCDLPLIPSFLENKS